MKAIVKRAIKDEKGAALALALVLLVVGGLILTPLLGLMSTGLLAGQAYERHTDRLYAADAGVEDAIWRIQTNSLTFNANNYSYPNPLNVNGKNVSVVVYRYDWDPTCGENFTYQILSTVITDDGGGTATVVNSTAINAHLSVSYLDLANLLNNAIVSDTFIGIKNDVYVTGNVTSGGAVDNKGTVNGTIREYAELDWPTAGDLSAYYMDDVDDLDPPFPYNDPLNVAGGNITLDALYRDGDWTIYNGMNTPGTVKLSGTVYVKGDLEVGVTNNDFTLDLNGETIFVESASADPQKAIEIGGKCTVIGSGCIIAVGDVYFAPKGDVGSEDHFVLVMSVDGTTTLRPSGTYYGCIAGDLSVDVQSGANAAITHTSPEGIGLNIPWGPFDIDKPPPVTGLRIESWEIE